MFGMDPVTVLSERDMFRWQVREAAFQIWVDDQESMMGGGE